MKLSWLNCHLLAAWMIVVNVWSKEYILEDLIAMETGNGMKRLAQKSFPTPTAVNKNGERVLKVVRTVEDKNVTSEGGVNSDTNGNTSKDDDDEDRKTLAQQVADGKYGLIQTELFVEPPKRPGIISYEVNPEVPKDNINNLGGLKPEEIWLAENHLLVLAGGGRYDENMRNSPLWPPIDNYKAPPRQVKIPPNPKVPPPFPVQLRPGGPTEYIRGANGTGGPPPFPFFPPPRNLTGGIPTPFFAPPINLFQGNFTPGNGPVPPFPFPPIPPGLQNGSIPGLPFGSFPPLGLPPGANFLPPPVNMTEPLDEDDPSIYYPPPYDFVYKTKNTSSVPAGPLVPGIVLPPPPDFFAPLEDEKRVKPKRPSAIQKPKRPQQVIPTQRPERPIHYNHHHFPTTTTTRRPPAIKILTDDPAQQVNLNEVTPSPVPHELPPNAIVQGWVPIPAPKPFYITGIRKPLKNPRLNNGYSYGRPQQENYPNDEPKKWIEDTYNLTGPHYINPGVYYPQTTTASPIVPYGTKGKTIKALYFYDEPNHHRQQLSTPIPTVQPFYTTSAPSRLQYYQTEQPPAQRPVKYFYITKAPPVLDTGSSTTVKPPVFEYSYTAPGYGTLEAPKLGTVTTTAAPPLGTGHVANSLPQYDNYYDYELAGGQPGYVTRTTPAPLVSTTVRPIQLYNQRPPKTNVHVTQPPYIVQTENPYHAFFTHQDYSLIDDITKKYFTIFGQKLNNEGPTTPLLPLTGAVDDQVTRRPQVTRNRVKFPTETLQQTTPNPIPLHATYPPAGAAPYWSTTRPSLAPAVQQGPQYAQYSDYQDYYDIKSNYRYQTIQDYYDIGTRQHQQQHPASLLQAPHISYGGDTRVNHVRPYPAKDPDAEEIVVGPLKTRYLTRPSKTDQPAPSLQHDTRVNYAHPLPTKDPEAEEPALNSYSQYLNAPHTAYLYANQRYPNTAQNTGVDTNYYIQQLAALNDQNAFTPETRQRIILNLYNELLGRTQEALAQTRRPPSLVDDTKVNDQFAGQNVTPDPDVEVFDPQALGVRPKHPLQKLVRRPNPVSLEGDTRVNDAGYVGGTPEPNAELFDTVRQVQEFTGGTRNGVIAYKLPGNSGSSHFYFLTPHAAHQQNNLYKRRNVRRQNAQQERRRARQNTENTNDHVNSSSPTSENTDNKNNSDDNNNNHKYTKR